MTAKIKSIELGLDEMNYEECVECGDELTNTDDMRYNNDNGTYLCESCARLSIYKYSDIRIVEE